MAWPVELDGYRPCLAPACVQRGSSCNLVVVAFGLEVLSWSLFILSGPSALLQFLF